jgi:hypothetical protein
MDSIMGTYYLIMWWAVERNIKGWQYVNILCNYIMGCGEKDKETALCEHVM